MAKRGPNRGPNTGLDRGPNSELNKEPNQECNYGPYRGPNREPNGGGEGKQGALSSDKFSPYALNITAALRGLKFL